MQVTPELLQLWQIQDRSDTDTGGCEATLGLLLVRFSHTLRIQTPPDRIGFFGFQSHPQNRISGKIPSLGHIWMLRDNHGSGKYLYEQPPLFGKERNSLWMETFFFQIHRAYRNEVGGNPKTR